MYGRILPLTSLSSHHNCWVWVFYLLVAVVDGEIMVQESLVLEPSLARMSVQDSAFTSHDKFFCGSMKGLVNSLPAQSLEFLQVVLHKGRCVRFYPKGCAAETYHWRGVGSSPFGIVLKQQTFLQPTQTLLLGFYLLWSSLLPNGCLRVLFQS